MFPIFQTSDSMLAVILCMVAGAFWAQRFKPLKLIGPALLVIITGIILVNLNIVTGSCELYGVIQTYCIPLSTSLYLLNVDFKKIVKMSKQPLMSIGSAVFCVCLVTIIFGSVFAGQIEEGWKVAGMFVGTYTGGSSNLTAIATGLNASGSTIAAANAADYVVGMPTMVLMFAAPALMKNSKKFQKFWPYSFTQEELEGDGSHQELMGTEEWSIKDIAIADGTTSALVASGAKWKSLISIGMLMGIIGAVCGNYVGIAVAYIIRAIVGG